MSDTAASKMTTLFTAVAALGALVGLMVNSGNPPDSASASSASAAVVVSAPAVAQVSN
jgi:hypothetical protein